MIRAECVPKKAGSMRGVWPRLALLSSALATVGCASARPATATDLANASDTGLSVLARTAAERELLQNLSSMPSGVERKVHGATVVVDPPYAAASGKTCRSVKLGSPLKRRLACSDGQAWFFVPGVFWDAED